MVPLPRVPQALHKPWLFRTCQCPWGPAALPRPYLTAGVQHPSPAGLPLPGLAAAKRWQLPGRKGPWRSRRTPRGTGASREPTGCVSGSAASSQGQDPSPRSAPGDTARRSASPGATSQARGRWSEAGEQLRDDEGLRASLVQRAAEGAGMAEPTLGSPSGIYQREKYLRGAGKKVEPGSLQRYPRTAREATRTA